MSDTKLLQDKSCNTVMHKLVDNLYIAIEDSPLGTNEYRSLGNDLLLHLYCCNSTIWQGSLDDNIEEVNWLLTATKKAMCLSLWHDYKIAGMEHQLDETFDEACAWLKTTIHKFVKLY